jgi:hypothetical protein
MSNFTVCPACQGTGRESNSGITYTPADLTEWAGEDHGDRADLRATWKDYGQNCHACEGRRVLSGQELLDYREDEMLRYEAAAVRRAESPYLY